MSKMKYVQRIGEFQNGNSSVIELYFNREESEYVVRVYRNGKHYAPADYFTDDKQDAILTGQSMLKEEASRNTRNSSSIETLPGCFAPEFADNLREAFRPSF